MKKISMIVADEDHIYIESFAQYIRNSEYSTRFDIKLFSKQEAITQFYQAGEKSNILLATSNILPQDLTDEMFDQVIYLSENEEHHNSKHHLKKYQPLSQLISEVLRLYYESGDTMPKRNSQNDSTKIITTYSAAGGTGKTVTAYTMARELAHQGHSVIYLNFELMNSIPLLFNLTDQATSSPLLYYIKTDAEQLQERLETYTRTDKETNIDFFNFVPSAEEMEDLESEEVELLIQALVETNRYNYIVIDLDSVINRRTLKSLKLSDHIYWLLNYDMYSFHKTSYLFEELHALLNDAHLKERVSFVLNRYTGQLEPKFETFSINIDGYLPYVPEWKVLTSVEQLLAKPVFNQHIQDLLAQLNKLEQGVILNDA